MSDRDEIDWIREHEPWRLEKKVETPWYIELTKIKGIGKETVEDLGRIFNNLDELKKALRENKVPLRNDIVLKLNKELEGGGK